PSSPAKALMRFLAQVKKFVIQSGAKNPRIFLEARQPSAEPAGKPNTCMTNPCHPCQSVLGLCSMVSETRPHAPQNNKPAAPKQKWAQRAHRFSNLIKRRNSHDDGEGCNQRHNPVWPRELHRLSNYFLGGAMV